MATNPFFKFSKLDQKLVEDLTVETIKVTGQDILYIPREYFKEDQIFGEDIQSRFNKAYKLEVYIQNVFAFDGQMDVVTKFGVIITDRMTIQLAKRRFNEEIRSREPEILRPREGDLIYFPFSGTIFEINRLEDEIPFYQLGTLTCYTLTLETFSYSHEEFNTGVAEIDSATKERQSFVRKYKLLGINSGSYIPGEYVVQQGYTATVQEFKRGLTLSDLFVFDEVGTYISGATLEGFSSSAGYTALYTELTNTIVQTDPIRESSDGDNADFERNRLEDSLFNLDETDPFSEGQY